MQALLAETRGQLEEKKQALGEERQTLTELKEFEQKLLKQLEDVTLVCCVFFHVVQRPHLLQRTECEAFAHVSPHHMHLWSRIWWLTWRFVQENEHLRNDIGTKEMHLDRLQGYGLDTLTSEELAELVSSLTAAADRVRRTINLRHVQHITTSRCLTGTDASTNSGGGAGDTVSAMSISGSPEKHVAKHSRGSTRSGWPSAKDSRSHIDQLALLTSSGQSKRSLDMDRRVSIDNLFDVA
jgi:hypothetical protein